MEVRGLESAEGQGEDETGSDRIDACARYNACLLLARQVEENGGKVSKMLGRKFLQATSLWEDEAAAVVTKECLTLGLPSGLVDSFVAGFSRAIREEDDLIWSKDLQQALRERQQARQQDVNERRERMQDVADEGALLRSALSDGQGDRIVEVDAEGPQ